MKKPTRIIYTPKASKAERNMGLEGFEEKKVDYQQMHSKRIIDKRHSKGGYNVAPTPPLKNNHPTVKPLVPMEYLCLLTKTPTGGVILDPFAGSGTTGMAAKKTGRKYILIEKEEEYCQIAEARIKAIPEPLL